MPSLHPDYPSCTKHTCGGWWNASKYGAVITGIWASEGGGLSRASELLQRRFAVLRQNGTLNARCHTSC